MNGQLAPGVQVIIARKTIVCSEAFVVRVILKAINPTNNDDDTNNKILWRDIAVGIETITRSPPPYSNLIIFVLYELADSIL